MKSSAMKRKVGDEAVKKRTGKNWAEWFKLLDKAGAKKMKHSEIANYVYEKHKVDGWYSQMIAVSYEQERGLRKAHERPEGYEISVSKMITVPLKKLYTAWNDNKIRSGWLMKENIEITKANVNKSIRGKWTDGQTRLSVDFYPKGDNKSQVVVQHMKLSDSGKADKMKTFWAKSLENLKSHLEK